LSTTGSILIPAVTTFTSMLLTLWLGSGLTSDPLRWFGFLYTADGQLSSALIGLAVSVGASNVAVGYVCNAITNEIAMHCPRIKLVDFTNLAAAFAIIKQEEGMSYRERKQMVLTEIDRFISSRQRIVADQPSLWGDRVKLKAFMSVILAEFHIRLHSHAPDNLIQHCRRRNQLWYTALNTASAFPIGCFLGLGVMLSYYETIPFPNLCLEQKIGIAIAVFISVLLMPFVLFVHSHKWNKEFWEVGWKWLHWDLQNNSMERSWWHQPFVEALRTSTFLIWLRRR
jgi:hypothetical protein